MLTSALSKRIFAIAVGSTTGLVGGKRFFCEDAKADVILSPISPEPLSPGKSRLIFLGTGHSSGTPLPFCLMSSKRPNCEVSRLAVKGTPDCNRNYRNSPSMLIQYGTNTDQGIKNILIDCGKHFRESILRWFPRFHVNSVDGVVITHDHSDAVIGMDDLRLTQVYKEVWTDKKLKISREPLPLFSNYRHIDRLRACFPYLTDRPRPPPHTLDDDETEMKIPGVVSRFVAQISWHKFVDFETFNVCGLDFLSLPVWHGPDYICMGFAFGKFDKVLYLSDVSEVPPSTLRRIKEMGNIDVLILDTLFTRNHPTHFSLSQACDFVREIRPNRTLLVGISHELEHFETNESLRRLLDEEGLDVQLAYDGLSLEVAL